MDITIPGILSGQGGVGQAIAQTGEELGRAGRSIGDYLDNIQKNYDYNDAVVITGDLEIKLQDHATEFAQKDNGTNPKAFDEYKAEQKKIVEEATQKASAVNERVFDHVNKHSQIRVLDYSLQVNRALNVNLLKQSQVIDGEQADISLHAALGRGGSVFDNIMVAVGETETKISARDNLYGGNAPTVFKGVMAKSLQNALDYGLKDPEKSRGIIEMMKDPKAKEAIMGYLTPEGQSHVQGLLLATGKDMTRQDAYSLLWEKYGGDFNAMNEALSNPKTQREYGLGMEDSFYIKGQISAAQADKEKSDAVRYDKTAKEVFLNLRKMTPGKIDMLVKGGDLDYKLGEHFKTELKQVGEGVSNHMTYFNLYSQVKSAAGNPDAIIRVRSNIFASGGLSFSDKKSLLSLTEGSEDKYEAGVTKQGADFIKNVVMPSQTLISAAKPKEAENYLDAMRTYNDAISKARDKNGKLDAESVNKIAKEVASSYTMSVYDQMDAAKDAMQKDKAKRQGGIKKLGMYKGKRAYTYDEKTFYDAQTGQVIK